MHLFCCTTEPNDDDLYLRMQSAKIDVLKMPLLDLPVNREGLHYVINHAHTFNAMIFTSPKSINVCSLVIPNITNSFFYVMGAKSAAVLHKIINDNPRVVINYPKNTAGSLGLITEVLSKVDFSNKRILLVKGSCGNIMLEEWLGLNQVNYTAIDVYAHIKININKNLLHDILSNKLCGIILTSGLMVDYLFELAIKHNMLDVLQSQKFFTIHPKIVNKLVNLGVAHDNIKVTDTANKSELLGLLSRKGLQHE